MTIDHGLTFVTGDGEMAELIREFDWSRTALGPLEGWPQSLRTTTALMLGSPVAMVLLWGPDGILIYNDAYARFADQRHPDVLGKPVRDAWPEIADFNSEIFGRVLAGETLSLRDQLLVLSRSGAPEPVYLDLDYSPVPDESGHPAGELVIVVETTSRREERLRQADERARLEAMFEGAPGFMALLDGPDHVFVLANAAYRRLIGGRDVVGLPLAEALPEVVEQGFVDLLDQVLATGEPVAMSGAPVAFSSGAQGVASTHYLDFVYQPLRDPDGVPTGVFVEGYDVTRLTKAQARTTALLAFNEEIAAATEIGEAAEIAARTLAHRLGGSRAGYARIDPETEIAIYEREWLASGVTPPGRQANMRDFGTFIDDLKAGEAVLIKDVRQDPRTRDAADAFATRGVKAFVALPVMERGRLSAMMAAVSPEEREWPDEDLAFLREVGERTRITIERLRSEEALRQREARLSFLDDLARAAVEARSAEAIMAITTEMTARHLGASNCAYADMDEDQDGFTIRGDWAAEGSPHITGHYSLAAFGDRAVQELSAGRPLIVNDNRVELPPKAAATFQAIGISATICMPLVREGQLVALMAVHHREPHVWTEDELGLVSEVTERSWSHIQRMAAEVALRDSEQRYKTLFDSIDEGFCIIEFLDGPHGPLSDYVHVEANPAYLTHTGIPNVVGQKVREMVPDEAGGWVELYRKVLETGEPMRFSKPLEINDRLLDVYTFRVEPADRRQVAVLFRDVTEQFGAETALRESEERYRTLFGSIDEGFCLIEMKFDETGKPVDYRFLEVNPAFVRQTGLDNAVGRWMRDLAPDHEQHWFDIYGDIARTGEPARFENAAAALDRFYDVYAFRVGTADQSRVAVLFKDISVRRRMEIALREEKRALEVLNETAAVVAADSDLESLVQRVVDAGVALTGAQFGAFFYNVMNDDGANYMLYALAGAPAEAFSQFPMPRNTGVFAPTFAGEAIVRSDDITKDARYGHNAPHAGMPAGHLPVRSYLAIPVRSRDGSVLGGLFFGHEEPGRFAAEAERGLAGLAGQAATAIDNVRLFRSAQTEIARRTAVEADLQALNANLETRVAEALAERRILADIVEGTDAFVQVADLNYRLLAINRASANEFERIYGIRPQVGDNMLKLLAHKPEHQSAVADVWARALGGETFVETAAFGDPALERRSYEMRFSPLVDETGRRIGAYQFVYDVTDRLRDQARLQEAEQALHQSQKMETVGQLTGGVAHDFNNLLTPIVGALDFLRRRAEDERTLRLTEGGLQAAERARVLVQRLLAFSRRQHLEPRPVDVSALIEGMADLIARSLGPQIELDVRAAAGLAAAMVDPNQLELAVLNLAVNARDAMPDGGALVVTVSDDPPPDHALPGRYVRICVSDTGHGMDAETLARAVEPFFTTKGVGRGTGLGLSSVHGLAVQSGGAFVLESEPGKGVVAKLWLPATDEAPDAASAAARTVEAARSGGVVLLVDDEDLVRHGAAEMLREAGFTVHLASGPDVALDMVTTGLPFDVMVTDYAMPGMNGADLAAAVRSQRPGAAILLITGFASLEDGKTLNLPRLAKPFRQEDLAEAVNRLITA